ncbi:hypothetical protein F4678DRAFT_163116 [Xylaria arbuscula]|nr:hypothetical protein F4678DRAFT_163116 [Xylaria arbuscula]
MALCPKRRVYVLRCNNFDVVPAMIARPRSTRHNSPFGDKVRGNKSNTRRQRRRQGKSRSCTTPAMVLSTLVPPITHIHPTQLTTLVAPIFSPVHTTSREAERSERGCVRARCLIEILNTPILPVAERSVCQTIPITTKTVATQNGPWVAASTVLIPINLWIAALIPVPHTYTYTLTHLHHT